MNRLRLLSLALLALLTSCQKGLPNASSLPVLDAGPPPIHALGVGPVPPAGPLGSLITYNTNGFPTLLPPSNTAYYALLSGGTMSTPFWAEAVPGNAQSGPCYVNPSDGGSARPAATGSGTIYQCTDIPIYYFDSPATDSWQQFAGEYLPSGNLASAYTTVGSYTDGGTNQGGIQLQQYGSAIRFAMYSNSTYGAVAVQPGTLTSTAIWAVSLEASWQPGFNNLSGAQPFFGVVVTTGTTAGSSTGLWWFSYVSGNGSSTTVQGVEADTFTVGTGTGSDVQTTEYWGPNGIAGGSLGRLHMRLLNDGTQLHEQVSHDGFQWYDVFMQASISSLTDYGFGYGQHSGNTLGQGIVYSNLLTTPLSYSVTAMTNATQTVATIGSHSIQVGDLVALHGASVSSGTVPNTATGTTSSAINAGSIVVGVSSTTITLSSGCGVYTSGGTITLLSR